MMTKRIIPVLLHHGHKLVKGKRFDNSRVVGHAMQAAKIHAQRGVDELIIIDVMATIEGRGPNFAMARELSEACFSPIAIGGGITKLEEVRTLLANGADKVIVGTAAIAQPSLITAIAEKFGSQAVTVSIDACEAGFVRAKSGREITTLDAVSYAAEVERLGAGEIILNSIPRDGMMEGYDLELITKVSEAVSIPVIAGSGAGSVDHMAAALQAGAHAVATGSLFQFTDTTPASAAQDLGRLGFPVRRAA